MKESSVSVIIPAYNASKTIERTVRSVVRQSEPPAELIIVDDASQDFERLKETLHGIVLPENTELIIHRNEENLNGAGSRNCGIQLATCDYIAFLDADDEWEPQKLKTTVKVLKDFGKPAIVYSKVKIFQNETEVGERPSLGIKKDENISEYLFLSGGFMQTSAIVCDRSVALEILFDPKFRRHTDYDFCLRAAHRGMKFIYVDEPLVRYQSGANLFSSRVENSEYSIWWSNIMKKYMSYYGYHGFMMFAISARFMAERRYLRALCNASYQAILLGPFGLWKARSKFTSIASRLLSK